jgi:hypothetical protein
MCHAYGQCSAITQILASFPFHEIGKQLLLLNGVYPHLVAWLPYIPKAKFLK